MPGLPGLSLLLKGSNPGHHTCQARETTGRSRYSCMSRTHAGSEYWQKTQSAFVNISTSVVRGTEPMVGLLSPPSPWTGTVPTSRLPADNAKTVTNAMTPTRAHVVVILDPLSLRVAQGG